MNYESLMTLPGTGDGAADPAVRQQVDIQAKYAGYIDRQEDEIARQRRNDELRIPADVDYNDVRGLSSEVRQKLSAVAPQTLGQASRVPGVTPAAISLLLVHVKKHGHRLPKSA
ncbi:MAG: tRNA uridine 5-carboxymethylaminomethyl modification enzyme [Gammaproteobacteria bacterium]|nr:MAG: tRNA uridine 5-carboxymethylaminomethyl modification enzyme [Gammaproteobacteria bacterium]